MGARAQQRPRARDGAEAPLPRGQEEKAAAKMEIQSPNLLMPFNVGRRA